MYDGSIYTQKKVNDEKVAATKEYSVELVSPILTYKEDIETLQEIVRKLRKAGCRFSASLLFLCCETSVRRDDYDIRSGSEVGIPYKGK